MASLYEEHLRQNYWEHLEAEARKAGLDVEDFRLGKTASMTPDREVPIVVNNVAKGSFVFDCDALGGNVTHRRRTGVSPLETLRPGTWPKQLQDFRDWLDMERQATDEWWAYLCEAQEAEAEEAHQEFLRYEGDSYLVDGWLRDRAELGWTEERARAEVQDPASLASYLNFGMLDCILKDRWATEGLCNALIERDTRVLRGLYEYAKKRKPKGRPGPKPKGGKYVYECVYELRMKGLTFGKIATKLWDDPSKANLAAAHYTQAKDKMKAG